MLLTSTPSILIGRWLVLVFLLIAGAPSLSGQSSAELKAKRQQLLEEIKANTQQLNSTRRDKAAAVQQLAILQNQIRAREELITTLQQEIAQTDASINRATEVVEALSDDVDRLKTEFSQLLQAAYRARLQHSWLSFLLSSENFNEAFRRWQYLRQYQRFRSRQARLIVATQKSLEAKLVQLAERRDEKQLLLRTEQQQQTAIGREKNAQDQLLNRLKKSEAQLLREIQEQKLAQEKLNAAIESAIVAEIDRMRRAERANTPAAATAKADRTSANSTFSTQRGRLPWPVSSRTINRKFGRQPHPTVKGVEISNNGIDIDIQGTNKVKVVANGTVVSTHFVPGFRNMILVRHGEYYTVYSNLESVYVSSQEEVSAGQEIGQISESAGDLHFEVWRQKERLNPERWIGGR